MHTRPLGSQDGEENVESMNEVRGDDCVKVTLGYHYYRDARGGFLPDPLTVRFMDLAPPINLASAHSDIYSQLPRTASTVQIQEGTNISDARSLASIELPITNVISPDKTEKTYHPFSLAVIAPLMPASVFGVLARLGLEALATYDGRSIFPLAYAQALGCLIMGICLPLKDSIS